MGELRPLPPPELPLSVVANEREVQQCLKPAARFRRCCRASEYDRGCLFACEGTFLAVTLGAVQGLAATVRQFWQTCRVGFDPCARS